MRKSRFTQEQIVRALHEVENGRHYMEVCRELGINNTTFYRWRARFGGLTVSETKRLKLLEEENRRLKQLVADQALDIRAMKVALRKKP